MASQGPFDSTTKRSGPSRPSGEGTGLKPITTRKKGVVRRHILVTIRRQEHPLQLLQGQQYVGCGRVGVMSTVAGVWVGVLH